MIELYNEHDVQEKSCTFAKLKVGGIPNGKK